VSPTTGKGLSRVLTDVKVLCRDYAPAWLQSAEIPGRAVREFYRDPRKVASDRSALDSWMHYHNKALPNGVPLAMRVKQRLKLSGWLA